MNAAIYARTAGGICPDTAIEEQIAACLAFVTERGWTQTGTFRDSHTSGARADRPGLQRLLDGVSAKSFEIVVVASISRLSRNAGDLDQLLDQIHTGGLSLVALDGSHFITSNRAASILAKYPRSEP